MKASDLFVACLKREGVERIFGVPGEENADVMISLIDSGIEFILCRHAENPLYSFPFQTGTDTNFRRHLWRSASMAARVRRPIEVRFNRRGAHLAEDSRWQLALTVADVDGNGGTRGRQR